MPMMPPPPGGMPPQDPGMGAGAPQGMDPMQMLLGAGGGEAPAGPDPVDQNAAIMRQFMQLDQMVDAIARAFPQAGEAAQAVKDGLKEMLVSIVSSQPGQDSAPAPRAL